jgi:hypothetical protein
MPPHLLRLRQHDHSVRRISTILWKFVQSPARLSDAHQAAHHPPPDPRTVVVEVRARGRSHARCRQAALDPTAAAREGAKRLLDRGAAKEAPSRRRHRGSLVSLHRAVRVALSQAFLVKVGRPHGAALRRQVWRQDF